MARPTKLTPELQEKICGSIAAGNFAETACAAAGVSTSTFYRWRERGEREESGDYAEFCAAIGAAEAEAESRAVAVVQAGMQDDPRLCMTFLERRFPRWQNKPSAAKGSEKPNPPPAVAIRIVESRNADGDLIRTIEHVDDDSDPTVKRMEEPTDASEPDRVAAPSTDPALHLPPSTEDEPAAEPAEAPMVESTEHQVRPGATTTRLPPRPLNV